MNKRKSHWDSVYTSKRPSEVSWFRPHLDVSLSLFTCAGLGPDSRVVDIGAGASTLIGELIDRGVRNIIAVDISSAALQVARERLGGSVAGKVQWIASDVTALDLAAGGIDIWHDRATLHFLTDPAQSAAYVHLAREAIAKGGYAIIGSFASDGPEKCSGLSVVRRDPEQIAELFGNAFQLVESRRENHIAPSGAQQSFAYALLRKS